MTDKERVEQINSEIEKLTTERNALEDTLAKSFLSKNRYFYFDYVEDQYYIKILSVNEKDCTTLEIHENPDRILISKQNSTFHWILSGTSITEEVFNTKYNETLNNLKI